MAEYTLIKDINTNLIYTYNSGWINTGLTEPLGKQNYIDYGIQNISSITSSNWDTLFFDEFEILTWVSDNNSFNINCISQENIKPIDLFDNPKLKMWVNTNDKINMSLNVIAESKATFLFSKDNRITWQTFNGTTWQTVLLDEIYDKGMSKVDIENITQDQWKLWFNRHYIDFAIGIKSQNINNSPTFKKIIFNFPKNECPVLSNFEINPSEINRSDVVLSAKINELEGDMFRYRIYKPTPTNEFMSYSLKFGNTTSKVSIPHTTALSPTKEITIDLDMKIESFANTWMPIIYKGNNRQYCIWINSNGRLYCSMKTSDNVERVLYDANLSNPLELNKYYHITFVINLNKGYFKLYKNGQLWSTLIVPTNISMNTQAFPLLIGNTPEVNASYSTFKGIIQNVRMWNRELTIDEINDHIGEFIVQTYDNLIGNWYLDDNKFTIKDYSINANNGTMTDCTWISRESSLIYFKEDKWTSWSDWINGDLGEYNLNYTFSYQDFTLGQNILALEVMDDRGSSYVSPIKYIELINNNPIITVLTHDNWSINGVINDPNGDKIKYRILINGVQKYPVGTNTFTELLNVPLNLNFMWDSSDLIIGSYNNEVKIEIIDSYGGKTEYALTDIIGRYKNLMFKVDSTTNSKYYSDDKGQLMVWDNDVLSYLNFGIMVAGQTSPSESVYIANLFGQPMENIKVWHEPIIGYNVDLSKDQSFIDYSDEIQFNEVLNDGEQRQFFIRIRTNVLSKGTGGVFELKTNGDIV